MHHPPEGGSVQLTQAHVDLENLLTNVNRTHEPESDQVSVLHANVLSTPFTSIVNGRWKTQNRVNAWLALVIVNSLIQTTPVQELED